MNPPNTLSDVDAPISSASGNALEQLFRENHRALIRFLRNRLRSAEEAADVAQEAYVRLLRKNFPGKLSFLRAYLFTTAGNIAIDRLRSRQAQARRAPLQLAEEAATLSPEQQLSDAQQVDLVRAYLSELPPAYREALLLYRFESLTTEQIGARMGIPGRTVRHYIAEALMYCRTRLERGAPPKGLQAADSE